MTSILTMYGPLPVTSFSEFSKSIKIDRVESPNKLWQEKVGFAQCTSSSFDSEMIMYKNVFVKWRDLFNVSFARDFERFDVQMHYTHFAARNLHEIFKKAKPAYKTINGNLTVDHTNELVDAVFKNSMSDPKCIIFLKGSIIVTSDKFRLLLSRQLHPETRDEYEARHHWFSVSIPVIILMALMFTGCGDTKANASSNPVVVTIPGPGGVTCYAIMQGNEVKGGNCL